MSEINYINSTILNNYKLFNNTRRRKHEYFEPIKIGYFFIILLFIFFIFILIAIVILLIRKQIRKFGERMRRVRLQNEINKIMMIDIYETRTPSLDSGNNEFHSINSGPSLNDINNSSNSVFSEIEVNNNVHYSKYLNDI